MASKVHPAEDLGSEERRWRAAGEAAQRFQRELESERRLDEAFAIMDRELYGRQMKEEEPAKTFRCEQCGATFSSQPAFAGHVGGHKRAGSRQRTRSGGRARPPLAEPRFKCRRCGSTFGNLQEISAHARVAHRDDAPEPKQATPSGTEQVPCPVCARPLPAAAAVVAREFQRKGVAQAEAEHLAAIAWGLLHVPS